MTDKYFEHIQTGKRYTVLSVDEEKKIMRLKGEHAEFDEPLDMEHFKKMGYVLKNGAAADAPPSAPPVPAAASDAPAAPPAVPSAPPAAPVAPPAPPPVPAAPPAVPAAPGVPPAPTIPPPPPGA